MFHLHCIRQVFGWNVGSTSTKVLIDENGNATFEEVFLPCVGHIPLPQGELSFKRFTGDTWTRSPDKRSNVPVVFLEHGQILLPRTLFAEARQQVYCSAE